MTLGLVAGRRPDLEPYANAKGSLREDILVAAYSPAPLEPTVGPCACGGLILVRWPHGVQAAVAGHNAEPGHQAWRARREAGG